MDRWYGVIGFGTPMETSPGVYEEQITERSYYGEVVRNTRRLQTSNQVNDDIVISNEFSIVADPYAEQNFHKMRYIIFMGKRWKITNVEVNRPRLVLTVGGVYNGKQA